MLVYNIRKAANSGFEELYDLKIFIPKSAIRMWSLESHKRLQSCLQGKGSFFFFVYFKTAHCRPLPGLE